jgi:hypothetical protein
LERKEKMGETTFLSLHFFQQIAAKKEDKKALLSQIFLLCYFFSDLGKVLTLNFGNKCVPMG